MNIFFRYAVLGILIGSFIYNVFTWTLIDKQHQLILLTCFYLGLLFTCTALLFRSRYSLLLKTFLHALIVSIGFFPAAWNAGFLPTGLLNQFIAVVLFYILYVILWVLFYLYWRIQVRRMNKAFRSSIITK
ncbi:DUF3021 family protein [Bacillus sp. JCM 19041]|uniref:DUF3021 domain-containing protein n=1 Tax=Bacillus sp. JCM 19041 TaxID=1460637 RepID=UPI0018D046E6